MTEEEQLLQKRFLDLSRQADCKGIVLFSDFLGLNEQNIFRQTEGMLTSGFQMSGGYEYAERQMVAFHPDALMFPWEYPIDCLKIEPKAIKFSEELTHRDYLGAILNLGVERSVVGDILVQEKAAWVFCLRKMTGFFLENLCRVRHTTVLVSKAEGHGELPTPHYQELNGTCASVRLDSMIALAFNTSRSSMVSFIEGGLVFVNGRLVTSNGYEPKEGDIISVRGKGRFLYDGISRQTKKGRYSVRLLRYI